MAKILLVEDEQDLAQLIKNWLSREQHLVEIVNDGSAALHELKVNSFDIIVLDLMIPEPNGLEVCRHYRNTGGSTPVIILTAKEAISTKEQGFNSGADDYLTKPFELKELALRIKALLRRGPIVQDKIFRINNISILVDKHKVLKDGLDIHLLPKEFRLLEFLVRHPNRIFSADELLTAVWESDTLAHTDTVRGHITRLRKKLDSPKYPSIIATIHGVGYRIENNYDS